MLAYKGSDMFGKVAIQEIITWLINPTEAPIISSLERVIAVLLVVLVLSGLMNLPPPPKKGGTAG